jgi:hypothetical protein
MLTNADVCQDQDLAAPEALSKTLAYSTEGVQVYLVDESAADGRMLTYADVC